MKLNKQIENFYKTLLPYAGLKVFEDGSIRVLYEPNDPLKSDDGRIYHLPYASLTKDPDGKKFFHILNELYVRPEGEAFLLFKKNLILEINAKLAFVMGTIIDIASQPSLQKNIKSREVIDILSGVGEAEGEMSDILLDKLIPKATDASNGAPIVDFFIKEHGEVDGIDYAYIGKTNFVLYKELNRALEEKEYKVFGQTLRKKDILVYVNVLKAIFPNIDNVNDYSTGTDNLLFGFLNALLLTSHTVSSRVNEVVDLINNDLDLGEKLSELKFDLGWVSLIEEMYDLRNEIKLIGQFDDIVGESNSKKLKFDESKVKNENIQRAIPPQQPQQPHQQTPQQTPQMPTFNPPTQQPQVAQQQPQQPQQAQTPQQNSLESMLNGMNAFTPPNAMFNNAPMARPQPQQWGQPQQPPVPRWFQQDEMRKQIEAQQYQQQQYMMQQQAQQPLFQQPVQNQYGMMGNNQMQGNLYNPYAQPQQPMMQQPMMQQPMMGQPYGYQQPMGSVYQNQWQKRDAFSQIEPSSLNGGGYR